MVLPFYSDSDRAPMGIGPALEVDHLSACILDSAPAQMKSYKELLRDSCYIQTNKKFINES